MNKEVIDGREAVVSLHAIMTYLELCMAQNKYGAAANYATVPFAWFRLACL